MAAIKLSAASALIAAALAFSTPVTARAAPDFGTVMAASDWAVGCDNKRVCQALSLHPADTNLDSDGILELTLDRRGGPQDRPVLTLKAVTQTQDHIRVGRAQLQIDGASVGTLARNPNGTLNVDDDDLGPVMAAMKTGRTISLLDHRGKAIANASLKGLLAVLDIMDQAQYRVGTISALAAPGALPADPLTIPPMPPRPHVVLPKNSMQPRMPPSRLFEAQLFALYRLDECANRRRLDGRAVVTPPAPRYERLDATYTLMILRSNCGGTNSPSRVFVIDNDRQVKPATFGPHPLSDDDPLGYLPNVSWDQANSSLKATGLASPRGDCGQSLTFKWDENHQFSLVNYASMSVCQGRRNFITTYRLDVAIPASLATPKQTRPRAGTVN